MANLMGVTNPTPNYDAANNNRAVTTVPKPTDTSIQNIVDPSKVVRPDGRTDQSGAEQMFSKARYDSNLQFFFQSLRDAPDLAAEITRAIVFMRGLAMTPGLDEGVARELAEFLQMLPMNEEGFGEFFLNQMQAGNRFSGALFNILRQIYQGTPNENMREAILNFVKRYSDYSSTEHIGRDMIRLLKQLPEYMPKSWHDGLMELTGKLENGLMAGTREENLKLLRGQILPYLGSYVERTHDLGWPRSMIRFLSLNIARYENGGEEGMLTALRRLTGYGDGLSGLNRMDDAGLLALLKENSYQQAVQDDRFAQSFAHIAARALRGEYGSEMREAFQEIVRAILLNESVYMPIKHGILPMEWEGQMVYSEFWVDPDAQDGDSKGRDGTKGGKIQFLFKMDLQSLGFMEMAIGARGDQVMLDLYAPDIVTQHQTIITQDLQKILGEHGFKGKSIQVKKGTRPLAITDVFPDLFEGKRSVDVKI